MANGHTKEKNGLHCWRPFGFCENYFTASASSPAESGWRRRGAVAAGGRELVQPELVADAGVGGSVSGHCRLAAC
jgi:hypothetical protein